jgi:DDE superfamily endonuclease
MDTQPEYISCTKSKATSRLEKYVKDHPFCLNSQIRAEFNVCKHTVRAGLDILGITRKRAGKPLHGEPTIEKVIECGKAIQNRAARGRLWSVDECYFSEKIVPLYVHCRRGERKRPRALVKSWKQQTLLLAISDDGKVKHDIFRGSCDRERFKRFITLLDGDILCDNASIHKNTGFSNVLFVPPYSPQYNPVEMAFSILKAAFRRDMSTNSVSDKVKNAMPHLLGSHCISMFDHSMTALKNQCVQIASSFPCA